MNSCQICCPVYLIISMANCLHCPIYSDGSCIFSLSRETFLFWFYMFNFLHQSPCQWGDHFLAWLILMLVKHGLWRTYWSKRHGYYADSTSIFLFFFHASSLLFHYMIWLVIAISCCHHPCHDLIGYFHYMLTFFFIGMTSKWQVWNYWYAIL